MSSVGVKKSLKPKQIHLDEKYLDEITEVNLTSFVAVHQATEKFEAAGDNISQEEFDFLLPCLDDLNTQFRNLSLVPKEIFGLRNTREYIFQQVDPAKEQGLIKQIHHLKKNIEVALYSLRGKEVAGAGNYVALHVVYLQGLITTTNSHELRIASAMMLLSLARAGAPFEKHNRLEKLFPVLYAQLKALSAPAPAGSMPVSKIEIAFAMINAHLKSHYYESKDNEYQVYIDIYKDTVNEFFATWSTAPDFLSYHINKLANLLIEVTDKARENGKPPHYGHIKRDLQQLPLALLSAIETLLDHGVPIIEKDYPWNRPVERLDTSLQPQTRAIRAIQSCIQEKKQKFSLQALEEVLSAPHATMEQDVAIAIITNPATQPLPAVENLVDLILAFSFDNYKKPAACATLAEDVAALSTNFAAVKLK
jgi:hypothetical protein